MSATKSAGSSSRSVAGGGAENRPLTVACLLGILISAYTLYVELKSENDPNYQPVCNIGGRTRCTRVLQSPQQTSCPGPINRCHAKGFGLISGLFAIPNAMYGIMYYCTMIYLMTYESDDATALQIGLTILAVLSTIYLGCLLIFVYEDCCVLCICTYILNFYMLYLLSDKFSAIDKFIKLPGGGSRRSSTQGSMG